MWKQQNLKLEMMRYVVDIVAITIWEDEQDLLSAHYKMTYSVNGITVEWFVMDKTSAAAKSTVISEKQLCKEQESYI